MHQEQFLQISDYDVPEQRRAYFACKRVFDCTVAAIALIVTAPFMLLIALLIKLDSSGPVLFRQVRLGRSGKEFVFYKFRSMVEDADASIHQQYVRSLIRNEGDLDQGQTDPKGTGAADKPTYKLTQDPRVTRVGRFLRRTSLDELPQLFNVIKGDMSLVGPRPPLPYEVAEYEEWHKQRLLTMPGITGLWQVCGRSRVSFDEMVRMDLDYMARQSLWLDFVILVRTIPALISGDGAM